MERWWKTGGEGWEGNGREGEELVRERDWAGKTGRRGRQGDKSRERWIEVLGRKAVSREG